MRNATNRHSSLIFLIKSLQNADADTRKLHCSFHNVESQCGVRKAVTVASNEHTNPPPPQPSHLPLITSNPYHLPQHFKVVQFDVKYFLSVFCCTQWIIDIVTRLHITSPPPRSPLPPRLCPAGWIQSPGMLAYSLTSSLTAAIVASAASPALH